MKKIKNLWIEKQRLNALLDAIEDEEEWDAVYMEKSSINKKLIAELAKLVGVDSKTATAMVMTDRFDELMQMI